MDLHLLVSAGTKIYEEDRGHFYTMGQGGKDKDEVTDFVTSQLEDIVGYLALVTILSWSESIQMIQQYVQLLFIDICN